MLRLFALLGWNCNSSVISSPEAQNRFCSLSSCKANGVSRRKAGTCTRAQVACQPGYNLHELYPKHKLGKPICREAPAESRPVFKNSVFTELSSQTISLACGHSVAFYQKSLLLTLLLPSPSLQQTQEACAPRPTPAATRSLLHLPRKLLPTPSSANTHPESNHAGVFLAGLTPRAAQG